MRVIRSLEQSGETFGVDAFSPGDPDGAGPGHRLRHTHSLGEVGGALGTREGLRGVARDDHGATPFQGLAELRVTGGPLDHDTPTGRVQEPRQVLGQVPRKPAGGPDDAIAGDGDDALDGLGHGLKVGLTPSGASARAGPLD